MPRIWTFFWRGAVGGVLGAVALIIYRYFTVPYRVDDLLIVALVSVSNGVLVGVFIWLLGRPFGVALRIIAGTLFSFCSMAFYLYLEGALAGDIKPFIVNIVVLGLILGAPAGAMAKATLRNYESNYWFLVKLGLDGSRTGRTVQIGNALDEPMISRLWSFVWRGAVGGILGLLGFVALAAYQNPMTLLGLARLPTLILFAGFTGLLVGATILYFQRLVKSSLGIVPRTLLGIILTSVLIGIYLCLNIALGEQDRCVNCLSGEFRSGFAEDPRGFMLRLFLIALLVGGLAGAMAKGKASKKQVS